MDFQEFEGWRQFFHSRPPGWREDLRAHAIMQSFGCKLSAEEVFPSIRQMRAKQATVKSGPSAGFFSALIAAAKKNGVDWNPQT